MGAAAYRIPRKASMPESGTAAPDNQMRLRYLGLASICCISKVNNGPYQDNFLKEMEETWHDEDTEEKINWRCPRIKEYWSETKMPDLESQSTLMNMYLKALCSAARIYILSCLVVESSR
jgi:hypothetical protein